MTAELLAALRARPGQRVHDLASALGRGARFTEALLRVLERRGRVQRVESEDHVIRWLATEAT